MQHAASQRKENPLDMRDLQEPANPCNALWLTRNEQVSGSSPLVGSLIFLQNPRRVDTSWAMTYPREL